MLKTYLLTVSFLLVQAFNVFAQRPNIELTYEANFNLRVLESSFCKDETVRELDETFWRGHCHFFIRFNQFTVDYDRDGDLDIATNLYETAYGKHGLGIIENTTKQGDFDFEITEMYHLNGDHGTLGIGDFDGNGHFDFYSPTVNYHGEGRFDGFLPDFYRGHAVHPNQLIFRFDDGFRVDTLESTDPFTTNHGYLIQGYNQVIGDMNADGLDDIFSIAGGVGLLHSWDESRQELWPIDTLRSGSSDKLYLNPLLYDVNGDAIGDLIFIELNKVDWTYAILASLGDSDGIDISSPVKMFGIEMNAKIYDFIGFEGIELDGEPGKELSAYFVRNNDDDTLVDSEIRFYDTNLDSSKLIDITDNYLFDQTNKDWTGKGNGFSVIDLNSDGYEDLFFANTHCYLQEGTEYCSDFAIFDGMKFHFSLNREDRKEEQIPIDLDGDGSYEIVDLNENAIGYIKVDFEAATNTEEEFSSPTSIYLAQNYPNPFNPNTQISYALPEASQVTLEVFNSLGQKVATLVDAQQSAGYHTASFDASQLSSGLYLYKLSTSGFSQTKKMLLVK